MTRKRFHFVRQWGIRLAHDREIYERQHIFYMLVFREVTTSKPIFCMLVLFRIVPLRCKVSVRHLIYKLAEIDDCYRGCAVHVVCSSLQ